MSDDRRLARLVARLESDVMDAIERFDNATGPAVIVQSIDLEHADVSSLGSFAPLHVVVRVRAEVTVGGGGAGRGAKKLHGQTDDGGGP